MPDNPGAASSDPNARRIIAYGLRNVFRFTIRPNTNEVWLGDVGYNTWEEINRISDPIASVKNFGWPCYEGVGRQGGYEAAQLTMCANLYANEGTAQATTPPYYTYYHSTAVPGDNCAISTGPGTSISSSITGVAFYNGGDYPSAYDGALFFADYSRACVWVMFKGQNGQPDPSTITKFVDGVYAPIQLLTGPGGDLYMLGLIDGHIRRVQYQAPSADIQANVTSGPAPLTVTFSPFNVSSPKGGTLSYSWDFNGDGIFGESTQANPTFTYTQPGTYKAWVRITETDSQGHVKWSNSNRVQIVASNTPPNPVISTPSAALTWKIGQTINFSGSATDRQDGNLAASALSWTLIINHCPSTCHQHVVQTISGVSSGSFTAPDHEYPSTLEIKLTATDSGNLAATTSVILNPQTVNLSFDSSPPGFQIALNSEEVTAPFSRTVINGSTVSVSAPWPQALDGTDYTFDSWSDNMPQSHTIIANSSASYTAGYLPCDALLVNNPADDPAPAGSCQVTLRKALNTAPPDSTVKFVSSLDPILISNGPLAIPSTVNLQATCQNKQQITASSVNKLRLFGNNTLEGLDIRLIPGQGPDAKALEYLAKEVKFKNCNSIRFLPPPSPPPG